MAAKSCGPDLLDWVGTDISASIFHLLDHPADLVRAAAVSRPWRRFGEQFSPSSPMAIDSLYHRRLPEFHPFTAVIENNLSKSLCLRLCPEVATVAAVAEVTRSASPPAVPVSESERDFRIYSNLAGAVVSAPRNHDVAIFTHCIGASSTDQFPKETMEHTLDEDYIVNFRPSYWSSGGSDSPDEPESLTYRLNHDICIVDEIKVQPFEAYFQRGDPIYSAKAVRFRMGHYKLPRGSESFVTHKDENKMVNADKNYMWTYTSPEYPMLQENVLQSFKLPRPVLCIGGVVMIELLGGVQKQKADDRYYICICSAQVKGRFLSPMFMFDISDHEGYSILKYLPDAKEDMKLDDTKESLEWLSLIGRYNKMNQIAVVNALMGPLFMNEYDVDDVSDDDFFE
ncbi:hypothetical protein QYE76_020855 [Lolium multiflorum]|uniref:F-box protein n=1 Tax=Lolium multiflorum TaxID=4521 RepID=A0AAD8R5L3_LOLMU|nr:hypothetical protein QYE76_020855 [Lolium multiflorum]